MPLAPRVPVAFPELSVFYAWLRDDQLPECSPAVLGISLGPVALRIRLSYGLAEFRVFASEPNRAIDALQLSLSGDSLRDEITKSCSRRIATRMSV